jgi:two-component system response regulator NreC
LVTAIRAAAINEIYIYPSLAKLLVQDYLQQGQGKRTLDDLTPREHEVIALLADGETNQQIGEELHISPKTVARHRENIMRKLNLHNRTELVKYAVRKGIINP